MTPEDDLKFKSLIKEFNRDVWSKAEEIDPNDHFCWDSLLMGWLMGKGVCSFDAEHLVIDYETPNENS